MNFSKLTIKQSPSIPPFAVNISSSLCFTPLFLLSTLKYPVSISQTSFMSLQKAIVAKEELFYQYEDFSGSSDSAVDTKALDLEIKLSLFRYNNAPHYGGAILFQNSLGRLSVLDSSFIHNSATCGGAIYGRCSEAKVAKCVFDGNSGTTGSHINVDIMMTAKIQDSTFIWGTDNSSVSLTLGNELEEFVLDNCIWYGNPGHLFLSHPKTISKCCFGKADVYANDIEITFRNCCFNDTFLEGETEFKFDNCEFGVCENCQIPVSTPAPTATKDASFDGASSLVMVTVLGVFLIIVVIGSQYTARICQKHYAEELEITLQHDGEGCPV